MILQSFKLDVIPDGKKKEIWLNQYDDDFVLQITLFSSAGTLSIPSGTTAAIRGTKPDGNGYSANAVLSDNVVTVTGDQQMTVVAGKAIFEITLYNDGKELNTANFILHIERAALDKDTPTSRSQTRELVEIEEHAEELIQAAEDINEKASDSEAYAVGTRGGVAVESGDEAYHNNAKYFAEISGNVASNFAPEYDATSTYSAGDLVVYENRLYQCNENIDTAEAWDSEHWTGVTVEDDLNDLRPAKYMMGSDKLLPLNADFNNYTDPGIYTISRNRQYVNSPVSDGNIGGVLEVYVFSPTPLIMQFIKSIDGIMYTRYKVQTNNWSIWFDDNSVRYTQQDKTDEQKATALDNIGAFGYGSNVKYMPPGSDFNDILESGVYQIYFNASTPNLNSPVNSTGMLIVTNGDYNTYDDYFITQCFVAVSDGRVYFRQIINRPDQQNSWSAWQYAKNSALNILFIGNSLTQDGIAYLPYMLNTYYPDVSFNISMWYVGGYTLQQQYEKFVANTASDIYSTANNTASWTNSTNVKMSYVLANRKFDIICMQPYLNSASTSVESELTAWNNCVGYIKDHYTGGNALKFVAMFHAPGRNNAEGIVDKCKTMMRRLLEETICEDVIPMGLAVYNALSTDLDSLGDQGHLSPDGTHTQEGLPCLLQTYVALQWCFDKLSIPKSVYNHKLRMTTEIYNTINVPGPNLGTGVITGTDAQNILAQEVAIKAYKEGKQNFGMSKPAEIIAETFDSAKSYVIGDYVIYNEVLYRFSKTHPAGAWDADDVSEVRIADVVEDISELISDGSDFTPIPFSISDFTYTEHGITRVQSAENGTIQVSGTADMNVSLPIKGENNTNVGFALTAGETYRLSGCPSSGSSSKYGLDLRRTIVGTIDFVDYGDGRVFTPSVSAVYYLHIRIVAGNPVNLTFAPVMEETAVGTSANDKVARKRLKDVTIVSDPGSEIPKVTTQYAMATNDEVGQLSRVWYQVREDEEFDGIRRDDGEYMFPMAGQGNLFSPNAPYHKIMRVMKTYIGNNNLVYGNDNTMGDETCTNEIDCSTFVTAVLNGVTYNHSRHVLGSDHQNIIDPDPGDTLMRYDAITGWRRLVTQQMAQWFARRGKLYKLPLNSQQAAAMLQFGDVLFSANPAGVDLKPYYQIRHCQLVLNTFPENGIVVVAQAGESVDNYVRNEQSVCNTSVIRLNADTIGYYRVFGRPSYGSDDTVIPKITAGNNNEQVFHPRFRLFAFVNNSTGEFAYAKTWAATYEYYPVEGGATITYTGEATDSEQANTAYIAWVAEYNTNKEFIKSTIFTSTPVMLDTDTRFVRFSFGHNASQDKTVHVTSLDDFGAKMTI